MVRLDHVLQAHLRASGAANTSLKVAQQRIVDGEICVDSVVTLEPKRQIVPGVEAVTLAAGGVVLQTGDHAFFLMHKPDGYICQRHPRERSVYDLVPEELRRADLSCVGRLDRDTTGTILLGTDGGLQSMLLFPTSNVWKEYTAECTGSLQPDAVARFRAGLVLEDGTCCAPATLAVHAVHDTDRARAGESAPQPSCRVRVTLHEGFFHQVKRMLAQCGCTVVRLHRERFGSLSANDLSPGEMRPLAPAERAALVEMLPADRKCYAELPDALRRRPDAVAPARQRVREDAVDAHEEADGLAKQQRLSPD